MEFPLKNKICFGVMLFFCILWSSIFASSPILMTFDGTFSDANTGLINGNRDVQVALNTGVDVAIGNFGTTIWNESHVQVVFQNGYMAIELGRQLPLQSQYFSGDALYFVVQISGVDGRVAVPIRYMPLAIRAVSADSANAVSANAIVGTIPSSVMVGAYPQITSVGSLTATLNATKGLRVGSLVVIDPASGVGIGVSTPTERLDVSGNIKLTGGRLIFSDGTFLSSAKDVQSNTGGPLLSTINVVLGADTDKNFTGDILMKTGDVERITVKNDGKVGIGVANPIQELEVNGAILVRNTTITNAGAIRFDGVNFEGYDGSFWRQLDVQSNAAGGWLYDDLLKTIVTQKEGIKLGVGITNPEKTLDVFGTVRATQLEGSFVGNGVGLVSLNATALNGVVSVANGGLGIDSFGANTLLYYDAPNKRFKSLPTLSAGTFLIGTESGLPVVATLNAGFGISIVSDSGSVRISHRDTSDQESVTGSAAGTVIQNIELDTYGHVTSLASTDLDQRFFTRTLSDSRFLNKSGDTLSGSYVLSSANITAVAGQDILLLPPTNRFVGIGTTAPSQMLDVNGALRVGYSEQSLPGTIRYSSSTGRFEGRGTSGWVPLDVFESTAGGWSVGDSGLFVYNNDYLVGVGTSSPQSKLHVVGNAIVSGSVFVSGDITVEAGRALQIGSVRIEGNTLKGDWRVASGSLNIETLNVGSAVSSLPFAVNGAGSFSDALTLGGTLTLPTLGQLRFGDDRSLSAGNMTGAWAIETDLSVGRSFRVATANIATLNVGGHALYGQTNTLVIAPTGNVQLGTSIRIADNTILATGNTGLSLLANPGQTLTLAAISIASSDVSGVRDLSVSRNFSAGSLLRVNTTAFVADGVNRTVGINTSPSVSGGALQVSGDVVVGAFDSLTGGETGKSNLYVEGNLIVQGSFVKGEDAFSSILVEGQSVLGSKNTSAVGIGTTTDLAAKLTLKSWSDLSTSKALVIRSLTDQPIMTVFDDGAIGVGRTNATAYLHLRAAGAKAPLKFTQAPVLASPEIGAVEFTGNDLFYTDINAKRLTVVNAELSQLLANKRLVSAELGASTVTGSMTFSGVASDIVLPSNEDFIIQTSGAGKVGIGTTTPRSALEVNGGLLIGGSSETIAGNMRYSSGRFQGYTGSSWANLDLLPAETGWDFTGLGKLELYTTRNVGIGKTNPTVALDVIGTVSANYVSGDGRYLRNLLPTAVSGNIPVSKGGTGVSSFGFGGVLVGNGLDPVQSISLQAAGSLLIGTGGVGPPVQGYLTAGSGLTVQNKVGNIIVSHQDNSSVAENIEMTDGVALQVFTVDSLGHVNQVSTKNLDNRYYTQSLSDVRYFNVTGDSMTGSLTFSGVASDILTASGEHLSLMPSSGRVGVGTTSPLTALDVNGGLRIGSASEVSEGIMRFSSGRFQGYDGSDWQYLDVQQDISGTMSATVFSGSGSGLTDINPNSLASAVPVTKGGTGSSTLTSGAVLVGNGTSAVSSVPMTAGKLLIGSTSGAPVAATLTQGDGLVIANGSGSISLSHTVYGTATSVSVPLGQTISSLALTNGHITNVVTANLDARYYTQTLSDSRFVLAAGDTMTGSLIFSGVAVDLTTSSNQHLAIIPNGTGKVGIGTSSPRGLLSVGGVNNGTSGTTDGSQLYLGGVYNSGVNYGGKKLHIHGYDNDGQVVYPLYMTDEDDSVDFYIQNRATIGGEPTMYVAGSAFFGTSPVAVSPGTVKAAYFIGDGSALTGLSPAGISGVVSVANGGTGVANLTSGGILYGNGTSAVQVSPVLGNGQLLIGKGSGAPTLNTLTAGGGVQITNGAGSITIGHSDTSAVSDISLTGATVVSVLQFDTYGHVTSVNTRSLDDRYYTETESDARFLRLSGGTMTGSLTMSGVASDIVTATNEHFSIMPAGTGKVGVGTTAPQQLLDVNGGIRIADSATEAIGSIRFSSGRFQGYSGSAWLDLDVQSNEGGIVANSSYMIITKNVGIGATISSPTTELEVAGTVSANIFRGDGALITNINPANFSTVVSVSKGGTGVASLTTGGVLFGNGTSGIQASSVMTNGQLLIGDGSGAPTLATLTSGSGLVIANGAGSINLSHAVYGTATSVAVPAGQNISSLSLTNGHITAVTTSNLDSRYYTQTVSNATYLSKSGGTLTGSLLFSGDAPHITTPLNGNFTVVPGEGGYVGIGTNTPQVLLDVAGAIKVSDSATTQEGAIRYSSATKEFHGRTDAGWVRLDVLSNFGDTIEAIYGTVSANTITGTTFVGNGAAITDLNPANLSAAVSVSKGGTGQTTLTSGGFLYGNGSSAVGSLVVPSNKILRGNGTGLPESVTLTAGNNMVITNTSGLITFDHATLSMISTITVDDGYAIKSLNMTNGHIVGYGTYELDTRYDIKSETDAKYLPKAGGTMTGSLILSGTSTVVTTTSNQNLQLVPNGTGKVVVGGGSPSTMLHVGSSVSDRSGDVTIQSNNPGVQLKDADDNKNYRVSNDGGSLRVQYGVSDYDITAIEVTSTQNVKIGTSTSNAKVDVYGQTYFDKTVGVKQQALGSASGSTSIDWQQGNKAKLTKTGALTVTFGTNPLHPGNLMVIVTHSGTGALTFSNVLWPGGVAPSFTGTVGAVDIVSFYWDGTNYYGMAAFDFKTP
jgi:hypothetical protein